MARLIFVCVVAATLSGCGVMHGVSVGSGEFFADHLPEWAGGLPADAPPRPTDPRYEKYIQDQSAKSMPVNEPAPTDDGAKPK
jgi:hypothetical protein